MQTRLLLVEDDASLGENIRKGLKAEGYAVWLCPTAAAGLQSLQREDWDLLVLDWMLPDQSGVEFLQVIRESGRSIPVIMLTARSEVSDRIKGLEAGADDYLGKPFVFAELLARIRSLLRRFAERTDRALTSGDGALAVDLMTRRVLANGKPLDLTPKEFDLMAFLIALDGEVVSRRVLVEKVWQAAGRFTSLDNVIDVHMANLRKKLREAIGRDPIETVRGVGYRLP
ncbi:MAG: DNA-binding response regulator [Puniceicoccaceae bacterium]|nr:MAG: DNA-binding response regulator [Puniceicoccaceae bacterium]